MPRCSHQSYQHNFAGINPAQLLERHRSCNAGTIFRVMLQSINDIDTIDHFNTGMNCGVTRISGMECSSGGYMTITFLYIADASFLP